MTGKDDIRLKANEGEPMPELLEGLNIRQKEAVKYLEGPLFVFAGPGTGKTKVTTHKIAYLIQEKGLRPEEVLALTFSKKAAGEMEKRVRDLLPGVTGFKISTFHAFCHEIIGENALELGVNTGLGVFTEEYQQAFLLEKLDDIGLEHFEVPTRPIELAQTFQKTIARFKQENITVERFEKYLNSKKDEESEELGQLRDLAKAYRIYEQFKSEKGFIDYGDMQILTLELFDKRPETLKRYQDRFKHIIVDEFQDTDFIQLRILFKLAPSGNLTVVGDDDQSIYRFRGAYLTNVLELDEFFTKQGKKPDRVVLDINYRCTPAIQQVASGLIKNNPDRAQKEIVTHKKAGDPVLVSKFNDDTDQANGILERVRELKEKGCGWEDIAVLVRRRVDARLVQEAFENAGVPFEIIGSKEFFQEPIIRAVMAYLKVLEDPARNQPSLGLVLQRPVHGILPGEVQKLGRYARDGRTSLWEALGALEEFKGDREHLQRFRKEMEKLFELKGEKGFYELVRAVLMGKDFYKAELGRGNMANIRLLNRFLELTAEFVAIYPEAQLEDFILHLKAFADLGLQDEAWEPAAGKVHLMTIHSSKGMEFPVVIIPCLNDGKFPSKYKEYKITIPDELADGVPPKGTPEDLHLQEERRLLYVGITRGKERVFLDYCERFGTNKRGTPGSVFLEDIKKGGKGFKMVEVAKAPAAPQMASAELEEAIESRLTASIARGEWQEAADALTALAKARKADVSGLKIPANLDLEEYARELDIVSRVPEKHHAEMAEYSPSKLACYDKCPMQYRFQYVLEIPGEIKTFFELGTLVHAVIERISQVMKDGKKVDEKEALGILDRMWKGSVYDSKEKEKQDRADAEEMVRKFLVHQAGRKGRILDIEKPVEMDLEGRKVRGRVDRIDDVGKCLEVIDYKSSKNRTSKPELKKDFQVGIYKAAVEQAYGKMVGLIGHWYLRMDQEWMVELTKDELEGIKARALEIIRGIEKGEFTATPGHQECMFCDYGELCGEGD